MKGSAPNCPATGSHVLVVQKANPKARIDSHDSRTSVAAMPATMTSTRAATSPVNSRNALSSCFLKLSDLLQRLELEAHDLLGQRRIAQLGRVFLPVGERPLHEGDHRLRALLVGGVLVEEHPRVRRDR